MSEPGDTGPGYLPENFKLPRSPRWKVVGACLAMGAAVLALGTWAWHGIGRAKGPESPSDVRIFLVGPSVAQLKGESQVVLVPHESAKQQTKIGEVINVMSLSEGRYRAALRIYGDWAGRLPSTREHIEFAVGSLNETLPRRNIGVLVTTAPKDPQEPPLSNDAEYEVADKPIPSDAPVGFYWMVGAAAIVLAASLLVLAWLWRNARWVLVLLVFGLLAGAALIFLRRMPALPKTGSGGRAETRLVSDLRGAPGLLGFRR